MTIFLKLHIFKYHNLVFWLFILTGHILVKTVPSSFATNRNSICVQLMRKRSSSDVIKSIIFSIVKAISTMTVNWRPPHKYLAAATKFIWRLPLILSGDRQLSGGCQINCGLSLCVRMFEVSI